MWLEGNWGETQWLSLWFYWNLRTPRAHCVSSTASMTYRPPQQKEDLFLPPPPNPHKLHNQFPWNEKRCVLITQHWCNTTGCTPPLQISMTSNSHSLREANSQPHSVPAAVNSFAKRSAGVYQTVPRLPCEPIAASQTHFKTNQDSNTAPQKKSLPLSASPPTKKNGSPHPRTECSSMGGLRRHECVVYSFSCKCVCMSQRE